jgi:hypothetical protein
LNLNKPSKPHRYLFDRIDFLFLIWVEFSSKS